METKQTGALGWPMVPSARFPKEMTLSCPKCGSTNITMSVVGSGIGSGSGGRWRLGDPCKQTNKCETCKHFSVGD